MAPVRIGNRSSFAWFRKNRLERWREGGNPEPEWKANGFITTIFRQNPQVRDQAEGQTTGRVTRQAPDKYPASTRQVLVGLEEASGHLPRVALQELSELRNREHFVNEHLTPLAAAGLIEMTLPAKPRSSRVRYRLTLDGLKVPKAMECHSPVYEFLPVRMKQFR